MWIVGHPPRRHRSRTVVAAHRATHLHNRAPILAVHSPRRSHPEADLQHTDPQPPTRRHHRRRRHCVGHRHPEGSACHPRADHDRAGVTRCRRPARSITNPRMIPMAAACGRPPRFDTSGEGSACGPVCGAGWVALGCSGPRCSSTVACTRWTVAACSPQWSR